MTFHHLKLRHLALVAVCLCTATSAFSQTNSPEQAKNLYDQIKTFTLSGGAAAVKNLTLTRDRAQMVFDGTFYFAAPVDGRVTGAVFVGDGKFSVEIPPSEFEKENVKRLLGVDAIDFADCRLAIDKRG